MLFHRAIVVIQNCKFQFVDWLKHVARPCEWRKVHHVLFKLHRHGGVIDDSANRACDHKHLVLVDELLRNLNGFGWVVCRVFNDHFQLATVDAAFGVNFVGAHLHACCGHFAKARQRA